MSEYNCQMDRIDNTEGITYKNILKWTEFKDLNYRLKYSIK